MRYRGRSARGSPTTASSPVATVVFRGIISVPPRANPYETRKGLAMQVVRCGAVRCGAGWRTA
jgi:hypothetical protein